MPTLKPVLYRYLEPQTTSTLMEMVAEYGQDMVVAYLAWGLSGIVFKPHSSPASQFSSTTLGQGPTDKFGRTLDHLEVLHRSYVKTVLPDRYDHRYAARSKKKQRSA